MTGTTQKTSLFSALSNLTNEIGQTKQAAAKQAEAPTPSDPGGYAGPTTHPTKDIDNRGQAATEGARSSENSADVKADQGAPSVENATKLENAQDRVQPNIGTHQSATGEDPSVEDDYKGGKDDPGTSHPARTDNSSLDGHKYASASITDLHDLSNTLANGILADLANGHGKGLTKEALQQAQSGNLNAGATGENQPAQPTQQLSGEAPGNGSVKEAGTKNESTDLNSMIKKAAEAVKAGHAPSGSPVAGNVDLQAGYDLAATLGVEKKAAQEFVANCVEGTINDALRDADLLGTYLQAFEKNAVDGASPEDGEDHSAGGDDTSGANGGEGTGGETSGGGGETGGGGGGGGDEMGGGGGSLGDMLGGGADPGGMMGGPMGGGDPMGGGMGQPSEEEALMELVAALDELGIPIEQLAQAGGGGGAGAPPMGGDPMGGGGGDLGGMPEMGGPGAGGEGADPAMAGGAPPMGEGMKLASAARAFRRSGKYQFKQANAGTRQRHLRDHMKSVVMELVQNR